MNTQSGVIAKMDTEVSEKKTLPTKSTTARVSMKSKKKKSDSAFKTISEVSKTLEVQQHVLRFWETKFSQIKPLKRGGGRRYYRPEDVTLLRTIHNLLYTQGYTIKGVQKLLKDNGRKNVVEAHPYSQNISVEKNTHSAQVNDLPSKEPSSLTPSQAPSFTPTQRTMLKSMLNELKELRALVKPQD